jgi:hypothetical protein
MHRSCFVAVLCALALVAGCGGSSTTPQNDGSAQSDATTGDANSQRDGATQQNDGPLQNDGAVQNDGSAPASHTENNGGVMHKPGKEDAKTNCVACHGADLTGGAGPSCYSCHNNNDHTINRLGKMHKSGANSTCVICHGPYSSTTGSLGPGCSSCH